jgi:hypothetical protein
MATSRILLDPGDAALPTSNPATLTKITSTGTPPANAPTLTYNVLEFNDATDQHGMWNFRLPDDYLSGGTITLLWGHSVAVAGNVIWLAGVELLSQLTTSVAAALYNAADSSGAVAVPGTANAFKETSIALTMTGAVAGAFCALFVGRDANAAGDTATGGVGRILAVQFSYTS